MTHVNVEVFAQEAVEAVERVSFIISPTNTAVVLHQGVVEYLQEQAIMRFDDEGTRSRGPWAELTEATVGMRESAGFPGAHPINIREGELFGLMSENDGIVGFAGQAAELQWPATTDALVEEKLRVAQEGKSDPFTPARPVIDFDVADAAAITELFSEWIELQLAMSEGVGGFVAGGLR